MTQTSLFDAAKLPDVCRNRHGGAENSEAANERLAEFKVQTAERIRIFVADCGPDGATLKETAAVLQHPTLKRKYQCNEISGRFTEGVRDGKLFKSGRRRDGAEVYVSRAEWKNGSQR